MPSPITLSAREVPEVLNRLRTVVVYTDLMPDGRIFIQARIKSEDGIVGHVRHELGPGESFHGVSYERLRRLTPGAVEVTETGEARSMES